MADVPTEVTPGLRFRSLVGDAKVLFEVREHIGKDYWECEGLDCDYEGDLRPFSAVQILGSLRLDEIFGGYDPESDVYQPADWGEIPPL